MRAAAHSTTFALAIVAPAVALVAGLGAWHGQVDMACWLAAFTLASILAAVVDAHASRGVESAPMPLSSAVAFGALLFFSPGAMTFTATAAVLTQALVEPARAHAYRRTLLNAAALVVATQAAGLAYTVLGGEHGVSLAWPSSAAPIVAAIVAFAFVRSAWTDIIESAPSRPRGPRAWWRSARRACPQYLISAAAGTAAVELIVNHAWALAPIVGVPAFFVMREYIGSAGRADAETERRHSLESLEHGVALVDNAGRVTLWNDALAKMLDCPRERAVGRRLVDAAPILARTALAPSVDGALEHRAFRTVTNIELDSPHATHFDVEILPDAEGAALYWRDVTARARDMQALRRSADRLALAAQGANDGLWEWDQRAQHLYVSPRWSAALGLSPQVDGTRPEEWFERMHPDDRAPFNEALDAHLAGRSERLQCEIRLRHADGAYRRFLCCGTAEPGADRWHARIAGSLTDLSTDSIARDLIRTAEFRDPLTGLENRAVFVKGLGKRLDDWKHARGGRFAVLYLDLDRFKVVNDSLGHLVGDELLTAVSRRLEACLRPADALARLGGDEFAILLNDLGDATQANAIAFRIQDTLAAPFSIAGREVVTSASIGIAICRDEYSNPEEMMRDADTAMYHAKANGKARHELFDADMHARALDRLGFENDLRQAIKSDAFELHFQPIVSLASGRCTGFESLVRWTRRGQPVSPAQFIPVAEELGLIEPLGTWVLQEACRVFAGWRRQLGARAPEYVTVNVSTRQLMQQGFVDLVEQAVRGAQLEPSAVRLEITETAVMDAPQIAAPVLSDLRDFGVKIYLDDFGTGYSSLSHLHKLPVDALKIDRSFVRSLTLDDRPAIVESILALARTLHTAVVAEGVESDAQARELLRLGCTHAQGFHFSRPLAVPAATELLSRGRPLGDARALIHAVTPRSRHTA